jgi:methionyl-tRNA formyltransferase
MKKRIAFAGCKDTTKECIGALTRAGWQVDLLITISPEMGEKNMVAGYLDLREFARQHDIPVYQAASYSLKNNMDVEALSAYEIDILLVIGWQRLIPEWLLEKLRIGAFGMHGSSHALPYGRGRSPMNWSLIQNRDVFISNLFKYSPGVDDGDILDTQDFDMNPFDNAKTMHYKSTLAMISLVLKNMTRMLDNNFTLRKQLDMPPTYYPKRTEEDGIIFWDRDSKEIYNLIRAVTRPFHGAFAFQGDKKIMIWSGYPFDSRLFDPYVWPGTILHVFNNGDFIVKTGDGSVIITEYEMDDEMKPEVGSVLHSANYQFKNPYAYPE